MYKTISVLLLLVLLILPAGLVIGYSYVGTSHPIEGAIVENDAFLKGSDNEVEILFFGFAGCAVICPLSLGKVATVLESESVSNSRNRVGGVFVEVKSTVEETGDRLYASNYSESFSSKIRGYTPDFNEYQQLAKEFILKVYRSRDNTAQISHTDHFFLLKQENEKWIIQRVIKNSVDAEELAEIVGQISMN
jgi:cytochrome oxidase Cu insertion factor (SCO1/SenC/PrrC family)